MQNRGEKSNKRRKQNATPTHLFSPLPPRLFVDSFNDVRTDLTRTLSALLYYLLLIIFTAKNKKDDR